MNRVGRYRVQYAAADGRRRLIGSGFSQSDETTVEHVKRSVMLKPQFITDLSAAAMLGSQTAEHLKTADFQWIFGI